VHAIELTASDLKVTSDGGTGGNDDSVVAGTKGLERNLAVWTNSSAGNELDTFGSHEINAALDNLLIELHIGDTIHEKTTHTISTLVDSDTVASTVKLVSSGETSRTRSNNGNGLAGASLGRTRDHPAHLESTINDSTLDGLDTNGIFVDTQNTGAFARGRADTTSEFREVVGHEQTIQSILPLILGEN
jgi:hypothetical protein